MKNIFKKLFCCEKYLQAEKQIIQEVFGYNIEKVEELFQDLRLLNIEFKKLDSLLCRIPGIDESCYLFYKGIYLGFLVIRISTSIQKNTELHFQNVSHELNFCKIPDHIFKSIFIQVAQYVELAKQQLKKQNNHKMMYLMLSNGNDKNNNN